VANKAILHSKGWDYKESPTKNHMKSGGGGKGGYAGDRGGRGRGR